MRLTTTVAGALLLPSLALAQGAARTAAPQAATAAPQGTAPQRGTSATPPAPAATPSPSPSPSPSPTPTASPSPTPAATQAAQPPQGDSDAQRAQRAALEREIGALQAQVSSLTAEVAAARQQSARMEQEVRRLEAERARQEQAAGHSEVAVQQSTRDLAAAQQQLATGADVGGDLERARAALAQTDPSSPRGAQAAEAARLVAAAQDAVRRDSLYEARVLLQQAQAIAATARIAPGTAR